MEVSAVPSNRNYPEGGDFGNRGPNMSYVASSNDPRGDYYSSPPRGQNYDYPQRQYVPQEREFVASHGSCSHCQTHCCQRPTEYLNQPSGSRGERLERYIGTVRNEQPFASQSTHEVRSRHSISDQSPAMIAHCQAENAPENESEGRIQAPSSPNQPTDSGRATQPQPVDLSTSLQDAAGTSHQQGMQTNDSCPDQATYGASSQTESPFLGEERKIHPSSAMTQTQPEPAHAQRTSIPNAPLANTSQPVSASEPQSSTYDSVATLMVPSKPSTSKVPDETDKFNPALLTHLNFKEKQLAMSAVKKAAANMNCVGMFRDKDKQNCGKIGRRDFQIVMDRIGVLRGMSSREIDAVFKGFATHTDTEIDYKKFTAACRHAIENDHRLARMAQK